MTVMKPLHNAILFQFLNETVSGQFLNKNKGRILLSAPELDNQGKFARWVKVIHVGPDVKSCKEGDIILVHPGKWTTGFEFDGAKFWKTDDEWVLARGEEHMAFDYAVKDH